MSSLKNPLTEAHGIAYSCYVASWLIAGGSVISKDFNAWLCSLGLTDKKKTFAGYANWCLLARPPFRTVPGST